ncbi:MAG: hypothetical protein RR540_02585, partial [Oscillospiraceae bacterium]
LSAQQANIGMLLQSGEISRLEYDTQMAVINSKLNFFSLENTVDKAVKAFGYNVLDGEAQLQLEITAGQLVAFKDFVQGNFGAIGNDGISSSRGIIATKEQLSKISIPFNSNTYLTPITKFPYYTLDNGTKTFVYFAIKENLQTGIMEALLVDGLSNKILVKRFYFDTNSTDIGYTYKYFYHSSFLTYFNAANNFVMDLSLQGLPSNYDSYILSTSVPTFKDGTVALPVDDVGIDIGNPSIPYDPTLDKDTPITVPIPDIDTIVKQLEQDLVDGKVNDLDIPDVIPDGLPNLIVSNRISEKFPFCVPFDFVRGIKLLVAVPEVPKVEKDLYVNFAGRKIGGKIILDFKNYEPVAKLIRFLSTLGFIMVLLFCTKKLMGGGN